MTWEFEGKDKRCNFETITNFQLLLKNAINNY